LSIFQRYQDCFRGINDSLLSFGEPSLLNVRILSKVDFSHNCPNNLVVNFDDQMINSIVKGSPTTKGCALAMTDQALNFNLKARSGILDKMDFKPEIILMA
jgi:hypothetical protein